MENEKCANWVGVDTHKDTLACYTKEKFKEFKTTPAGFKQALKWAKENNNGDCNWAIEGAYCFGKPFASFLTKNGCKVYEINPYITKSWRSALSANGNKNDYGDAKVISIFSKNLELEEISLKTIELKERITARELLVKQRTKLINSIKMLYYTKGEELEYKNLTSKKAIKYLMNHDNAIIKNFGEIIEKLNNSIKELDKEIFNILPDKVLKLTHICGIDKNTAATIYTETKGKIISQSSFANYCATAPIEQSSGKTIKHSVNKRGNRKLNSIFFRISICQSIHDEARKCLARQICNTVFRILKNID